MTLTTHRLRKACARLRDGRAARFALAAAVAIALAVAGCGSRDKTQAPNANADSVGKPVKPGDGRKPVTDKPAKAVESTARTAPTAPEPGPLIKISQDKITIRWVEKNVLRMSAAAREVEGQINEVTRTGVFRGFSADLYENGKITSSMTAPKVVVDTTNRVVTATGGVMLKSMERSTIVKAQWMKWYAKEQKVIGNGGVKIKSDAWDLQSAAFVADTGLKTITLKNSAKGLVPE